MLFPCLWLRQPAELYVPTAVSRDGSVCCARLLESAGLFAARVLAARMASQTPAGPAAAAGAPLSLDAAGASAAEGVLLWALEQGHAVLSLAAHNRARLAAAAAASAAAAVGGGGGEPGDGAGGALQGLGVGGLQLAPGARALLARQENMWVM